MKTKPLLTRLALLSTVTAVAVLAPAGVGSAASKGCPLTPSKLPAFSAKAHAAACGLQQAPASKGGPSSITRIPPEFYGMNGGSRTDTQLQGMSISGASWVRSSVRWRNIEPTAPENGVRSYDWQATDASVAALARNQLRYQPFFLSPPKWNSEPSSTGSAECGESGSVPSDLQSWATFVAAFATRYGRDGQFWALHPELPYEPVSNYELWNEVNMNNYWCPSADPAAYAALFVSGAAALHGVDPQARALLGSFVTTGNGMPPSYFLKQALAAQPGIRNQANGIAFHLYGPSPDADLAVLNQFYRKLRQTSLYGLPLLINEIGWPVAEPAFGLPLVDEATRARYFYTLTDKLSHSDCPLLGVAPYTWNSAPSLNFGLADAVTGQPFASGLAYGAAIDRAQTEKGKKRQAIPVCS
jgi:hypothetical protein